jgi:hypothetical protein
MLNTTLGSSLLHTCMKRLNTLKSFNRRLSIVKDAVRIGGIKIECFTCPGIAFAKAPSCVVPIYEQNGT